MIFKRFSPILKCFNKFLAVFELHFGGLEPILIEIVSDFDRFFKNFGLIVAFWWIGGHFD